MLLVSGVFMASLFAIGHTLPGETAPICHLEQFIDEQSLIALVEAKDGQALRRIWSDLPYRDLIHRVVYYTRLVRMEPTKSSEVALLETLPGSPLEFYYIYAMGDTVASKTRPAIPELYGTYFKTVGRLAAKHPAYIPRVLLMSRFSDGEVRFYTNEVNDILRASNPNGYLAALKTLDSVTQTFVCGDCPELRGGRVEQEKER
jgi:hypothetical protein